MDMNDQPREQQIDAQALLNALTQQRNDALNQCAQLHALLSMKEANIKQLEVEVKRLRGES